MKLGPGSIITQAKNVLMEENTYDYEKIFGSLLIKNNKKTNRSTSVFEPIYCVSEST